VVVADVLQRGGDGLDQVFLLDERGHGHAVGRWAKWLSWIEGRAVGTRMGSTQKSINFDISA
jgi:hypothetical protein